MCRYVYEQIFRRDYSAIQKTFHKDLLRVAKLIILISFLSLVSFQIQI